MLVIHSYPSPPNVWPQDSGTDDDDETDYNTDLI